MPHAQLVQHVTDDDGDADSNGHDSAALPSFPCGRDDDNESDVDSVPGPKSLEFRNRTDGDVGPGHQYSYVTLNRSFFFAERETCIPHAAHMHHDCQASRIP